MTERTRRPAMKRRGSGVDAAFRSRQARPARPRKVQIEWTLREIRILERHYPTMTAQAIRERYLPHRTAVAISLYARLIGVQRNGRRKVWTKQENNFLRKYYPVLSPSELQRRYLPQRTRNGVIRRAMRMGLRRNPLPRHRWTAQELAVLRREWVKPGGRERAVKKLGLSVRLVISRARSLGLHNEASERWTKREEAIIRKKYPVLGTRLSLKGRTRNAVFLRARAMGLRRVRKTSWNQRFVRWTATEEEILRQNRHLSINDLLPLLPGRSANAIQTRRGNTAMRYKPKKVGRVTIRWTDQEIEILERHIDDDPESLTRLLPGRSVIAIRNVQNQKRRKT